MSTLIDRVMFRAASSGTGSFVVSSAITGYMTPATGGAINATVYSYAAESDDKSEWEIGTGTYTTGDTTLTRTPTKSSNSDSAVNFTAAPKVALTALADDLPTPTEISNWNTAYGWGNHASAGYLTTSTAASTYQPLDSDLTSWAGVTRAAGFDTWVATPSWTNFLSLVTGEPTFYTSGGTDVSLADGGTGASLTDPNADRIMFWDDSAGAVTWLAASTGLTITTTNIALSSGAQASLALADTSLQPAAIGSTVQPYDADTAKLDVENQALTGGVTVTSKDLGTQSSGTLTLDMGDRPLQHYTNNGAHTLAPGSVNGACLLDITNGASAGAITLSGWSQVIGDDFLTTTNTDAFRCHCSVRGSTSLLSIVPLQGDVSGGVNSQTVAKAWVNFQGTGTVAIRDSYNVSSITDNGAGNYTVNFTNAMANSNYAAVGSSGISSGVGSVKTADFTTGSVRLQTFNSTPANSDYDTVCLVVFGD